MFLCYALLCVQGFACIIPLPSWYPDTPVCQPHQQTRSFTNGITLLCKVVRSWDITWRSQSWRQSWKIILSVQFPTPIFEGWGLLSNMFLDYFSKRDFWLPESMWFYRTWVWDPIVCHITHPVSCSPQSWPCPSSFNVLHIRKFSLPKWLNGNSQESIMSQELGCDSSA